MRVAYGELLWLAFAPRLCHVVVNKEKKLLVHECKVRDFLQFDTAHCLRLLVGTRASLKVYTYSIYFLS